MGKREKLLDLVQVTCEAEEAFVASLSEAQRTAAGTLEKWSAKDTLAHMIAWKERLAEDLAAVAHGQAPSTFEDVDRVNAEIFEAHRDRCWADVLEWGLQVQTWLAEQVRALTEEELADSQRLSWQRGRPLWRVIAGTSFLHPLSHLAQAYVEQGDMDQAAGMLEGVHPLALQLDDSPAWQSIPVYNLACLYALSGQKEKAIARLGEALGANPDLTDWSRQDPDLASIREDPACQALYAG